MADLYGALGLKPGATKDDIRKAYRKKAKTAHPDAGGSPEAFQSVALAHRILSDDEKRAKYDADGSINDAPNQEQAAVMSFVATICRDLFEHPQAFVIDLAKEGGKVIDKMIAEQKRQKGMAETALEKSEKLRKRFKVKKGPNIIGGMLDHRIADLKATLVGMDKQIELYKKGKAIFADATYEFDKPAPNSFGGAAGFGQWQTVRFSNQEPL